MKAANDALTSPPLVRPPRPRLPHPPQLLVFDLDGTLIGSDLVLSARVQDAVRRAREGGIAATLATGRMFVATQPFARTLGITGPIVCYQGAAVYEAGTGLRLRHTPVENEIAARITRRALAEGLHVQLYFDDRFYVQEANRFSRLYADLAGVEPVLVPSLLDALHGRESTKIVIVSEREDADRNLRRMRDLFGEVAYVTRSYPEFVEILNPAVDKGEAIGYAARRLGLSLDRALAVGDSWNDVPLLRACAFGVAMGSAPRELLEVADAVVADVAHDGVAEALERYVFAYGGNAP